MQYAKTYDKLKFVGITIVVLIMLLGMFTICEANSAVPNPGYLYFRIDNVPKGATVDILLKKNDGSWYSAKFSKLSFIKIAQKDSSEEYVLGYKYESLLMYDMKIVIEHNGIRTISGEFNGSDSIVSIDEGKQFSFLDKYDYSKVKELVYDCNSKEFKIQYIWASLYMYLVAVLITISVELFIAMLSEIKKHRLIIVTNLLTQILLHVLTFVLFSYFVPYNFTVLLILEFIIWFIEYNVYSKYMNGITKKRIFSYVLAANITTFALTLIVPTLTLLYYFIQGIFI